MGDDKREGGCGPLLTEEGGEQAAGGGEAAGKPTSCPLSAFNISTGRMATGAAAPHAEVAMTPPVTSTLPMVWRVGFKKPSSSAVTASGREDSASRRAESTVVASPPTSSINSWWDGIANCFGVGWRRCCSGEGEAP